MRMRNTRPIGKPVWPVQKKFLRLEKLQEWPTTCILYGKVLQKKSKQPRYVADFSYTYTCKTSSRQVYDTCNHFLSSLQVLFGWVQVKFVGFLLLWAPFPQNFPRGTPCKTGEIENTADRKFHIFVFSYKA